MRMTLYYLAHSVKNQIRKLLRTWVAVFLLVCFLFGALVGIAGARLGYPVLEHIASVVICLFILKAAYDIFVEAMDKMLDHSAGDELEEEIRRTAEELDQVRHVDLVRSREFGSRVYVDIEISCDGGMTLAESHKVAEHVHQVIEERFDKVKHIMVHVNPDGEHGDYVCKDNR